MRRTSRVEAAVPLDPHAGSREKILDTAESYFARRGCGGVGLREISRAAGLSKSALFHHFPSKLELYGAVLARILDELDRGLAAAPQGQGTPLVRLRRLIEALIDALAASPTRAPLLLRTLFEPEVIGGPGRTPEADALLERILGGIEALIEEGIERGEIRPLPVPHAIQSLVGLLLFHFASGPFGDEVLGARVYSASEIRRHKQFVVSFVERGLAARPDDATATSATHDPAGDQEPRPHRKGVRAR